MALNEVKLMVDGVSLNVSEFSFAASDNDISIREPATLHFSSEAVLRIPTDTTRFSFVPPPKPPVGRINDDLRLLPFRFTIQHCEDWGTELLITASVVDTEPNTFNDMVTFRLPISPKLKGEKRARRIRKLLAWCLLHELNECLRYTDGRPVVEPHPEVGIQETHPDIVRMGAEAAR